MTTHLRMRFYERLHAAFMRIESAAFRAARWALIRREKACNCDMCRLFWDVDTQRAAANRLVDDWIGEVNVGSTKKDVRPS